MHCGGPRLNHSADLLLVVHDMDDSERVEKSSVRIRSRAWSSASLAAIVSDTRRSCHRTVCCSDTWPLNCVDAYRRWKEAPCRTPPPRRPDPRPPRRPMQHRALRPRAPQPRPHGVHAEFDRRVPKPTDSREGPNPERTSIPERMPMPVLLRAPFLILRSRSLRPDAARKPGLPLRTSCRGMTIWVTSTDGFLGKSVGHVCAEVERAGSENVQAWF